MHHPTDRIAHSLCYTSRGALAGTRNSSMGPPVERVSVHKPIPNCVYLFNTYTTGGVLCCYLNQTDLQKSYIFRLDGFQLTRGITISQLM